jgi:release factor glutamine methyltransferase
VSLDDKRWRDVVRECEAQLAQAGFDSAAVDVRRIVEEASGQTGAEYHLALDEPATRLGAAAAQRMVRRRCTGEPLQYVLGGWGFRQLDLMIDRRVLIPRPETEIVVDHALAAIDDRMESRDGSVVVADLGTGSGAIALSIAVERSGVDIWATDRSSDALAVARANLAGVGRRAASVRLAQGDWFAALPVELAGTIDVVVSNPPYVAETDDLPVEVADWEPVDALVAGPLGSEAVENLLNAAPAWLADGGAIVVEISPIIEQAAVDHAVEAGLEDVTVRPDHLGRPRVLLARRALR